MPLYEYLNPETGKTVELHRPVEDRNNPVEIDGAVFKRAKFVPSSIIVFGARPSPELLHDHKILKGYYRHECEQGSRFRSGYSKKTLAKVYEQAKKLS